ncbi:hypothetical protein GN244_ATG06202 [Phytophthora infestans]|uniref:Uncharacterized protein n=1 Tax=Phytophthora infestans TaxID=4787 RepID=A0A833T0U5_PHYIN|nr:hypothetical protein GN244_ATG06202 [Phytophthora infestans]
MIALLAVVSTYAAVAREKNMTSERKKEVKAAAEMLANDGSDGQHLRTKRDVQVRSRTSNEGQPTATISFSKYSALLSK